MQAIKILLVEDNPDDVRLTEEALHDAGLPNQLSVVEDGEEALQFMNRTGKYSSAPTPDLILLDLNLPRKNGHAVLREIKAKEQFQEIPIVLLTVSQNEDDIARAVETGMTYYMRKPVEAERLASVLEAISIDNLDASVNSAVYRVIAGNPQTPRRILAKLAHHIDESIRKRVAENPKLDPTFLAAMSHDYSPEVRLSVASNPAVSSALLSQLSRDENPDVRLGIAERFDIPMEILKRLSQDENPYVAAKANETMRQLKPI